MTCMCCPEPTDGHPTPLVNGPADLCRHHRQRAAEAGLIKLDDEVLIRPLGKLATTGNQAVSAHINAAVNGERRRRTGS